jgi:hypothetical protein
MNRVVSRIRLVQTTAPRLLLGLHDGSVRVFIVDPPYPVARRSGNGHLRDWFGGSMSWPKIGAILALARRKLAPDGVLFCMTNTAGLADAIAALETAGFERQPRVITCDRQYPGLGGGLRHQTEYILVGRLPGSRPLQGVDLISVAAVGPGTADRYPTQKPDQLGRELARIAGVRRGDLVVDPFVGSGSLLVGALARGATVVGSDISARAIAQATERLGPGATVTPSRASGTRPTPTRRSQPSRRTSTTRSPRSPAGDRARRRTRR